MDSSDSDVKILHFFKISKDVNTHYNYRNEYCIGGIIEIYLYLR